MRHLTASVAQVYLLWYTHHVITVVKKKKTNCTGLRLFIAFNRCYIVCLTFLAFFHLFSNINIHDGRA